MRCAETANCTWVGWCRELRETCRGRQCRAPVHLLTAGQSLCRGKAWASHTLGLPWVICGKGWSYEQFLCSALGAAKSKTNEGCMNHLVSWLLFWLPYLLKIFPVPTFFVPFLSTLIKDSFSLLTLKFPEKRTCCLLYLSSFKGTQTGDFLKALWPTCWSEGFDYHCFKWMIFITLIISFKVIFKIIGVFYVIPFCSCPPSFPASGSFPVSRLFTSGGKNIGVSASAQIFQWIFRTDFL